MHGSDALTTSAVLAAAVAKSEPDLVICGMSSTDGVMGVVPVMIAERLGWPAATLGATLNLDDNTVSVRRDADNASLTIEADLPAVVSVTDQSGEARYPSMKGILAAKKKPVESWTLADLDIDSAAVGLGAARTKVLQATPRPPKEAGKVITDEGGSGAAALADFLVSGKYI
jgi:electron transfer flavoprotein beta subunit